MNTQDFLFLLGFKTTVLCTATVTVWFFLRLFRCRSPKIHRTAWGVVLLLGTVGAGVSVSIPVKEHSPAQVIASVPAALSPFDSRQDETSEPAVRTPDPLPGPITHPEVCVSAEPVVFVPDHAKKPVSNPFETPVRQEIAVLPSRATWRQTIFSMLPFFWLTGIAGFLSWRFSLYWSLLRRLKTASPAEGDAAEQWSALCREQGVRPNRLPLLLTDHLGPGLVWRPSGAAVLVPRDLWEETTPDIREGILRHELAHYRGGDMLRSGLARLLALVHWFNPLAWFALKKMDEATEWVCDREAFGTMPGGTLCFARSMVAVHEAAPTVLLSRYAFGNGKIANRTKKLQEFITQPKESAMKRIVISSLLVVFLLFGTLQIRFVTASNEENTAQNTGATAEQPVTEPGIQVELTDVDGKPCTTGYVRTYPNPRPKDWEGDQPRNFDLKDGKCFVPLSNFDRQKSFKMVLFADGFAPYERRWPDTSKEPLPDRFTFKMPDRAAEPIGGRVINADGEPVAGAVIEFGVSIVGRQNLPATFVGTYAQWIKTDENGYWVYKVLPKEQFDQNFSLTVNHDVYPIFRITEGRTFKDYAAKDAAGIFSKTITLPKGVPLRGKIVDEKGDPVSGVIVHTNAKRSEDRSDNIFGHAMTRSDEKGGFLFENCAPKGELRTVDIGVCHRDFAPNVFRLETITPAMAVEIVLKKGKKLILKAVDKEGNPLEGMRISSNFWKESWGNAGGTHQLFVDADRFGSVKTGKDGRYAWNAPESRFDLVVGNENYQNVKVDYETLKYGNEENVFVFRPVIEVTGTVLDAETGRAIPSFQVSEWFAFKNSGGLTREFGEQKGKDGHFVKKTGRRMGEMDRYCLRVDADGYEGMTSEPLDPEKEKISLTFSLKKGGRLSSDLVGTLLQPDGRPAANAEIGIAKAGSLVQTRNSRLNTPGMGPSSKTDAQGRFSISRNATSIGDQDYKLLFLHDTGTVTVDKDEFEKREGPITLLAWARIEGTITVGNTPGRHLPVLYSPVNRDWERGKARIFHFSNIDCDEKGHFVIDRAFPNVETQIGRGIRMNDGKMSTGFMLRTVVPKSGETLKLDFGGGGHTVTGTIVLPKEFMEKVDWRFAHVEATPAVSDHAAIPELSPEEEEFRRGLYQNFKQATTDKQNLTRQDIEKLQKQQDTWEQSQAGKEFIATNPEAYERIQEINRLRQEFQDSRDQAGKKRILCNMDDKGGFRLDDMKPGNWTLEITLNWPKEPGQWSDFADVWKKKTDVTVPNLPNGPDGQTLGLGSIPFGFDPGERKGPGR